MAMPIPGAGQAEIAVELGASRIGPALGVMADDSHFGMAGLRGSLHTASGTGIVGSVLAGTALGATDGHFVSGLLEGRVVDRWSPNLEARLEGRLMGFGAATPFPYRSNAIEGGPSLRWWGPDVSLEVTGLAGIGLSRIELWRVQDGPTRVFEQELRRAGGTAELLLGPPTSQFGLVGGWHHTPKGDYRSVGARAVFAGPWGVVELRADRWITPLDAEVVAGLALVIPIGSAWSVRGFFGRTEPDPLTLAQPGEASGGMMVGRSFTLADVGGASSPRPSGADDGLSSVRGEGGVVEIVGRSEGRSVVRFALTPPVVASTVQVLGDFSLWEPLDMEADGRGGWQVDVEVREGVHHFGFLVDDEWYVPDDAPDVVADEWGRRSATLVIEGAL
ncbi:MAG: glycogen-binding domain-containing protein [Longimicrobiales bacterium]|nr:glycogen-binding domain-containing protein [Longimicrobiales bacterium]